MSFIHNDVYGVWQEQNINDVNETLNAIIGIGRRSHESERRDNVHMSSYKRLIFILIFFIHILCSSICCEWRVQWLLVESSRVMTSAHYRMCNISVIFRLLLHSYIIVPLSWLRVRAQKVVERKFT